MWKARQARMRPGPGIGVPDALKQIRSSVPEMIAGVGTILTPAQVRHLEVDPKIHDLTQYMVRGASTTRAQG